MIVNFQIEIPQKDGRSITFERRNDFYIPPKLPVEEPSRLETPFILVEAEEAKADADPVPPAAAEPDTQKETELAEPELAVHPISKKKLMIEEPVDHIDLYYDVLAKIGKKFDIIAQENVQFVTAYNTLLQMDSEPFQRKPTPADSKLETEMETIRHRRAEFETELRRQERALTEHVLELEVDYEEARFGLKRLEKADIEKSERYLGLLEETRLKKFELAELRAKSSEQADFIARLRDEKTQSERYNNQIVTQKAALIQQSLEKEK
jgi:hypothetical protein